MPRERDVLNQEAVVLVNPAREQSTHATMKTALMVTSTYEKYFRVIFLHIIDFYGNSSARNGFGARLRARETSQCARFSCGRLEAKELCKLSTGWLKAIFIYVRSRESVCRLRTVEMLLMWNLPQRRLAGSANYGVFRNAIVHFTLSATTFNVAGVIFNSPCQSASMHHKKMLLDFLWCRMPKKSLALLTAVEIN